MRLLLDTHAFIYAFAEPAKLPERVRNQLLDPAIERWVSVVSIWEIAVKVQIGKLDLPLASDFYESQLRSLRAKVLPVTLRHSLALLTLPMHHRDPFDRLLIAQATEEHLTLVTRDAAFAAYGIPTIW